MAFLREMPPSRLTGVPTVVASPSWKVLTSAESPGIQWLRACTRGDPRGSCWSQTRWRCWECAHGVLQESQVSLPSHQPSRPRRPTHHIPGHSPQPNSSLASGQSEWLSQRHVRGMQASPALQGSWPAGQGWRRRWLQFRRFLSEPPAQSLTLSQKQRGSGGGGHSPFWAQGWIPGAQGQAGHKCSSKKTQGSG